MNPGCWSDVHGATTHFPIALVFAAVLCDTVAVLTWTRPAAGHFRSAGTYAITLGALGSVPAVVSGLVLTRGEMLGHGALRWHHLFVWPAFGLIVAAAAWRFLQRSTLTRRACASYLAILCVLAALIAGTGYWGGAMMRTFP